MVVFLTELEGLKTHFYLIYLTPLYSILLAVAVRWMWLQRPRWRWALYCRDAPVRGAAGDPDAEFRLAQPAATDLRSGGAIPARAVRSEHA